MTRKAQSAPKRIGPFPFLGQIHYKYYMLTLLFVYLIGFIVCLLGFSVLAGAINSYEGEGFDDLIGHIMENWWQGIVMAAMWPILGFASLGWVVQRLWATRHPLTVTKE